MDDVTHTLYGMPANVACTMRGSPEATSGVRTIAYALRRRCI